MSDEEYDEPFPDDEPGDDDGEPARPLKAVAKAAPAPRKRAAVPPPLAEAQVPGALQGEVRFTRSVRVGGRDDNAHFSVMLQFNYQPGMGLDDLAALAADYFFQAKGIVFQEANLPFSVDENGVVHEVLRELEQPRTRKSRDDDEPEEEEERPRRRSSGGGDRERSRRRDDDDDEGLDLPDRRPNHIDVDVWRDLKNNPDDWYDNRPKKKSGKFSANAPDFKNKDTDEAVWLTPPRRGRR